MPDMALLHFNRQNWGSGSTLLPSRFSIISNFSRMRIFRFLVALLLTSGLLWALSTVHIVADKPLPPLGSFFNPFSGFWKNAEPQSGLHFKPCDLAGLQAEVQVVFDDMLVPHIFAQNTEDAVMVQGYLTAQFRLFQMDLTTRKASGRLSEVLGMRTFEIDRKTRRRGMTFAAENDLLGWSKSPRTMALLKAYTEGVNAWIEQLSPAEYPVEYKLLNFKPEPWTMLKSALVTEAMAETLCSGEDDLEATNALALYGRATFDYLYPEWNPQQQPIIPDTGQWKDLRVFTPPPAPEAVQPAADLGFLDAGQPYQTPLDEYIVGSNNWAVSAVKTQNGHALLANDPHLNLTLPSIWFQVQIHTPETNVYGVSLPGVPGVVIGFNENIAWGVTNVGHDVSDFYRIQWVDEAKKQYKLDQETKHVTVRIEEIKIKGKETFIDTVRYTVWGPMAFEHEKDSPLRDYAFRWLAHDIPEASAVEVFFGLNIGKHYADYKSTLTGYDAPAQNFVFASKTGDIALQVQGKYPVRGKEQGRFLQDGSKWANATHTYVPWDQVPSMKNPSRGFVFSANQHSTPPTYPYYYLGGFEDDRSRRIYNRLDWLKDATPESMKSMQLDNFSQRAADCLPAMLNLLDRKALNQEEIAMVDLMANWDFQYNPDQLAPTIYEAWSDSCYLLTWDEMTAVQKAGKPILFPEVWRWIDLMKNDTTNIFFDIKETTYRETAREVVLTAFKQMSDYFKQHPEKKLNWGQARPVKIKHLAQIDAFSRLDLPVGGHKSAPNAINNTHGPSWRMIVDLGEQITAQGVYPGGQSGNPGSKWYDNMVDIWAKGQYLPLVYLKSAEDTSERIMGKQRFSPN